MKARLGSKSLVITSSINTRVQSVRIWRNECVFVQGNPSHADHRTKGKRQSLRELDLTCRRNGWQMIFAAGEGEPEKSKADNHALVVALARAWQWQEELESGQYSSIGELADANQVDRTYVSRLLQLTSLAPDLVESLLAGDDCEGLSLRQLRKGIPLLWSEQRESFGS